MSRFNISFKIIYKKFFQICVFSGIKAPSIFSMEAAESKTPQKLERFILEISGDGFNLQPILEYMKVC